MTRARASTTPRVSVVVPSYQHADYVEEAVRSALDAELPAGLDAFRDLEVVVVDDGSTDDSVERLRALGDPRLRLFVQENRGAHAAFNRGLGLARGELIFLLNSDDAYTPDRLEKVIERFDADPDLLFAASWIRIVDGDGRGMGAKEAWRNLPPWPRPCSGPGLAELGDPALALLESNWVSTTSNLAFRRRIGGAKGATGKNDPFDSAARLRFRALRYCHDWDFLLELASLGEMAVLEEPLVRYRVHGENTIREGADGGGPGSRRNGEVSGPGAMRFEILWLLARHSARVLSRSGGNHDPEDLRRRLWNGLPRFGGERLLTQLFALRGVAERVPEAYDRLLDPEHPFRRQAARLLAEHGEEA